MRKRTAVQRPRFWILTLIGALSFHPLGLSHTIVGNGDDGSDLEKLTEITEGPILSARKLALEKLERLGVNGIPGLGMLVPELAKSPLYLVDQDISSQLDSDKAKYHSNESGQVFARTIAQPHSATRFFPVATELDSPRLIALHIHEALHRALSAGVRENENVVSEITLAIVSPEASNDSIRRAMERYAPLESSLTVPADPRGHALIARSDAAKPPFLGFPSSLSYSFQNFVPSDRTLGMQLNRSHVLESNLYPFGGQDTPFGMGVMFSVWETDRGFMSGPLGLSARLRLWTRNRFEVGLWGQAALNMLSNEELKNSLHGRDFYSAGLFMRKSMKWFYVENFVGVSARSEAKERIGAVDYRYEYGEVVNVKVRAGASVAGFDLGGFAEVHLGDHLRVSGGKYFKDSGRYRIVSVGPEVSWTWENLTLGINGRYLLDHTKDANLTYIGNLFGVGTGQGHIGTLARISF